MCGNNLSTSAVKSPFRFFNTWVREPGFFEIVREAWNVQISGTRLFVAVRKLANVKKARIEWRKKKQSISSRIQTARLHHEAIQNQLQQERMNSQLVIYEKAAKHTLCNYLCIVQSTTPHHYEYHLGKQSPLLFSKIAISS